MVLAGFTVVLVAMLRVFANHGSGWYCLIEQLS
jgi:hypothetical protein